MRLLDLYCGAGGAAAGYSRAGFEVVGVDLAPQPRYPYTFIQADALEVLRLVVVTGGFDAIHASPPCQAYSSIAKQRRAMAPGRYAHPDLVADTRQLLQQTGAPYVIENVIGAPLADAIMLCGSSFGLDVRRHRLFELGGGVSCMALPCAHYWQTPRFISLDKRRGPRSTVPVHGGGQLMAVVGVQGHLNYPGERELREKAMGIDWMNSYELTQAIPPAYTEYIGRALVDQLTRSQPGAVSSGRVC